MLTVLGVLFLGQALAVAAISGRTRPPVARLEGARAALAAASAGAAPRWAAEELRQSGEALARAEAEYGRQGARLWPRRDFQAVADLLWSAETRASRAGQVGEERRVAARTEAEDALEAAGELLAAGEGFVAATAVPPGERAHIARARLLVAEARSLLAAEEYALATARAESGRLEMGRALGPSLLRARRYASGDQVRTWRRWIDETRAWSRASGRSAIVVVKERNELRLLERGRGASVYAADIGANAIGRKLRAGDGATPEGRYRVVAKKGEGRTRFHKALLLDYPNAADRQRLAEARRAGELPRGVQPGGLIEIHGEGGRGRNWTDGCVALSNVDMDEVFARVEVGSWVTIVGGDGGNGTFSGFVDHLDRVGGER